MQKKTQQTQTAWRAPIVGVLGHVDHGKTTLLDALRKTAIWDSEAGGITQHISWSTLNYNNKQITFIDTPGHQAFSIMREIGGKTADVILLIVAADAGVQPQTKEAIEILKAAQTETIVVITKIDLEGANADKVKQQLSEEGILVEGWGGKTPIVEVSAKTGQGLTDLLEMIILIAELKELTTTQSEYGLAVILDAWVDKSMGKCLDAIIIKGSFKKRFFISSPQGTERAGVLFDQSEKLVNEVSEGNGVRIISLSNIHSAGKLLYCAETEKGIVAAKEFFKNTSYQECELTCNQPTEEVVAESLEELFTEETRIPLNLILKADTPAVLDAVRKELDNLQKTTPDVEFKLHRSEVGPITIADVENARASKNSLIVGFNVPVEKLAEKKAKEVDVSIKTYAIIYRMIDDIKERITLLTKPTEQKDILGKANVKQVFILTEGDKVAGSIVTEGKITKGARVEILRKGEVIGESTIQSLRILKEKVDVVNKGFECGIIFKDTLEVLEGDEVVTFRIKKIN
ncbi:GTP-binding protein [Candidatus Dojkabacteria bacterium]|nr:GTP-binding protein [Candidatus Dojkabacteria bacterium]